MYIVCGCFLLFQFSEASLQVVLLLTKFNVFFFKYINNGILNAYYTFVNNICSIFLHITLIVAEQPLQGMESQEKEAQKD